MMYLGAQPSWLTRSSPAWLGSLITPACGWRRGLAGVTWAADNGCFTQGAAFSLSDYFAWLDSMQAYQDRCLFATAPDVLADAHATWQRSTPVLPQIAARGWAPALVAQDGITPQSVDWSVFDWLFLGGSTAWKVSSACALIAQEARRQGKRVHMGRVNSYARLSWAQALGCESVDGTFLRKAPDNNMLRVERWMAKLNRQPSLLWTWDIVK